jgi:ABC-type oligopeptide transport system substrate-binding subunit
VYYVAALFFVACGVPQGEYFGHIPDDIDPHHLRWCNQGEPDSLDPARASSTISAPLISALYDGLTIYGADGTPVPGLATHWDISEDLRTYTFHLRGDGRWTNGRTVTAYDFAYGVFRVANRNTASPNADNVTAVKNLMSYLAHTVAQLRRDAGPYHAGDVVEIVQAPKELGEAPDLGLRTSSHELALRDLGAVESAAYARAPAGTQVSLVMLTGQRATLPSPGGAAWAYVYWARDNEGVYGWVPASELDGEPLGDAAFSIRRVTAKNAPGVVRSIAELDADEKADRPEVAVRGRDLAFTTDLLGISVPDAQTITFELSDPTPSFVALSANRAMRAVPIEAASRWPVHWATPGRIITSGPLHLDSWDERVRLELVRSPTYRDQSDIKLDRLTVISLEDQAANTNFYYSARCDATANNTIPSTYLPALNGELRDGKAFKDYSITPLLSIYFIWVNTKRFTNVHLRRALSLAIDRGPVPRFIHGGELPTAVLSPGLPISSLTDAQLAMCGVTRDTPGVAMLMSADLCYVPPPGLDHDVAAAKRELAIAKQEMGASFPKTINYRFNVGSEAHKQIAEYLQAAWGALGLHVELETQDWNSMLEDSRQGKFDLLRFGNQGSLPDTESDFLAIFRCASPDNRGKWCNEKFEQLMDEARTMRDLKARLAKVREAESVMLEDAPIIPLYVYTQKHLIKPYVRDYAMNLIDQPALWRIWLDPDWKRR